jgi:hypothetical protein
MIVTANFERSRQQEHINTKDSLPGVHVSVVWPLPLSHHTAHVG